MTEELPEKGPPEDLSSEKKLSPVDPSAERPLECTECKKPVKVWYTEVVGSTITHQVMCADCPVLQRQLGHLGPELSEEATIEGETGLCCGSCGTTLQAIRTGHSLGCSNCYEVFTDVLVSELAASGKLVPHLTKSRRSRTMHIGRAPGEKGTLSPSLQLVALNEAMRETLSREDYEQAAWLRDQIKELTEQPDEGQE